MVADSARGGESVAMARTAASQVMNSQLENRVLGTISASMPAMLLTSPVESVPLK